MVSVNFALDLRKLLLLILSDDYIMPIVLFCRCKDITESVLNDKLSECERFSHSFCSFTNKTNELH